MFLRYLHLNINKILTQGIIWLKAILWATNERASWVLIEDHIIKTFNNIFDKSGKLLGTKWCYTYFKTKPQFVQKTWLLYLKVYS